MARLSTVAAKAASAKHARSCGERAVARFGGDKQILNAARLPERALIVAVTHDRAVRSPWPATRSIFSKLALVAARGRL
jgi:hypothetical protein